MHLYTQNSAQKAQTLLLGVPIMTIHLIIHLFA